MSSAAAPAPRRVPVHAVIAVKNLAQAKTRLAPALPKAARAEVVLAMLADTLAAASASTTISTVTVVTPDPRVSSAAVAAGARVLAEPPLPGGPGGLNTALRHGASAVRQVFGPVAVLALQADLPALRPPELAALLAAAPAGRSIVADHYGNGTAALLCHDRAADLDPHFGPDSAAAHVASGAVRLDGDWPGLRLDVDTAADLDAALRLGAGPATRAALRAINWPVSAV